MVPAVLDYEIKAPKRTFSVNQDVVVLSPEDLSRRYTQTKAHQKVSIGAVVANEYRAQEATL